ncbi:MAG: response regulator transcription factor [Oscillospiraceae bacterium]|nr:MAG: response regulator transcription factor [Oscillospiraceae bacterium]
MKTRILVIDDDVHISELLKLYLEKEDYEVEVAHDGGEGLEKFKSFEPKLVLLDIMLPVMDGWQVCREIRRINNTPIIMLTAKGETFDKVLGLELGADDYIVKPFEPKELIARVKAILRRTNVNEDTVKQYSYNNLTVNISDYTVVYYGKELDMPPKEIELLFFLASHPNKVFTREQLLEQVWGFEYFGDSRTVDVHIKRIREKMPVSEGWSIKTVWGIGYKFEVKDQNS